MQNIGADNAGDAFYRYKMPKLVAKVEGRGNGIKTNVVNNVDIARALSRPPTYTLKHFGCELGAQTNFNQETGTSIVNGAHTADKLSEVLEIFIKKYVQCYGCGNPETVVKVRKGLIHLKCKACGHTSDVDMRDKLTTYILKNPPENKLSKSEEKVKKAEKERMRAAEKEARKAEKAEAKEEKRKKKEKRDGSKRSKGEGDDSGDGGGSDDKDGNSHDEEADEEDEEDTTEWKTDMSAAAVARRQREQLTAAAAALVQGGDQEESAPMTTGSLSQQNSNAAANGNDAAARATDSTLVSAPSGDNGAAAAGSGADESESGDYEDGESDGDPVATVQRYISRQQPARGLFDFLGELPVDTSAASGTQLVARMKVFYQALLGSASGRLTERMAPPNDKYILALKRDVKAQAAQLIALEHYVTQLEPERMGEMPFVLKWLYEEDLIDEEIIVQWGDAPAIARKAGVGKAAAAEVRALSQKVLDWLQEASSDEDGDV